MPLRRHRPQPLSAFTLPSCVGCLDRRPGRLPVVRPTLLAAAQLPHHASAGLSPGWTLFPATQPWSVRCAGEVSSRWTFFFSASKGWGSGDIG
ncbi:unnamed protein product [Triticum turgidum subsp. durum]|uniref:Uncharacterized protein n=1 Tax=Triticum turgidum subsp. durum TaxID=4567 RepID=A0A9R0VR03_TRITD|nr:unnamed protein product [Triticum turgidum subsp. durum]